MTTGKKYLEPQLNLITNLTELDARVVPYEKANGKELNDLIRASVIHAHEWVETDFPSILHVTQKQFASLNLFTEEMYHTTDRMFIVHDRDGGILCVMEVMIGDEIDTIDDIDEIIKDSEELLAQKDFKNMEVKKIEIDPTKPNVLTPGNFKNQF